ncbi:hypothetical protein [Nocardia sp. NBC_01327]|uniref:hypothetical protein n=1 Tax=Nocardia sp. NBC_01327 TaxID=2903593 RepID=UPI002E0F54EE|nr:hypothetical protein OG326_28315 [Nocardia sp. NBC_01327]
MAEPRDQDKQWDLYVRPANYLLDDRTTDLRAMVEDYFRDPIRYLDWLFGAECDRMVARIDSGVLPDGSFETDPASSAAALVAEVANELGVTADAAALYLQLATLTVPSDRNIRLWNGWKPARHRAAEAVLADNGLVVRDKRGRVGRGVFLPGKWIGKPGIEDWKWQLHALEKRYSDKGVRGVSTPHVILPELFRAAWQLTSELRSRPPSTDDTDAAVPESISPLESNSETVEHSAVHAVQPAGPDATAVEEHPLDDYTSLGEAVCGHHYHNEPAGPKMLRAIRITSNLLRGGTLPPAADQWIHASGDRVWTNLLPGIGVVALRAVSPVTSGHDREYLLALLEVWADTVFADPAVDLLVGRVETTVPVLGDARGVAVALGESHSDTRGFVAVRPGEADPPALGVIHEVTSIGPRWGDAGQLHAFVAAVRERGPAPWDAVAVEIFVQRTGMSPAASALILAGYLGWYLRPKEDLSADQRRILGIGPAAAEDGAGELNELEGRQQSAALLARILPDDPDELWQAGGMQRVAGRAADAWVARHGRRPAVPESTRVAAAALRTELNDTVFGPSGAGLCAILAAPDSAPVLVVPQQILAEKRNGRYGLADVGAGRGFLFHRSWRPLIEASRWAYSHVPASDPVHEGARRTLELLRLRLRDPGLVLRLTYANDREIGALSELSGISPVTDADGGRLYDDGLVVAWTDDAANASWTVHFRPANYGFTAHSDLLRATTDRYHRELSYVDWLFGPDCDRILARLTAADLPAGGYETDPRLTAPALVANIADKLQLDTDAATLYLQLLTLLDPTDRNIRRWNGWKTAHHKTIEEHLITRNLLLRDERKRAGRTAFLPGPWVGKPGMELWKLPLHDLVMQFRNTVENPGLSTPRRALPDLFHAAWQRIRTGDLPA